MLDRYFYAFDDHDEEGGNFEGTSNNNKKKNSSNNNNNNSNNKNNSNISRQEKTKKPGGGKSSTSTASDDFMSLLDTFQSHNRKMSFQMEHVVQELQTTANRLRSNDPTMVEFSPWKVGSRMSGPFSFHLLEFDAVQEALNDALQACHCSTHLKRMIFHGMPEPDLCTALHQVATPPIAIATAKQHRCSNRMNDDENIENINININNNNNNNTDREAVVSSDHHRVRRLQRRLLLAEQSEIEETVFSGPQNENDESDDDDSDSDSSEDYEDRHGSLLSLEKVIIYELSPSQSLPLSILLYLLQAVSPHTLNCLHVECRLRVTGEDGQRQLDELAHLLQSFHNLQELSLKMILRSNHMTTLQSPSDMYLDSVLYACAGFRDYNQNHNQQQQRKRRKNHHQEQQQQQQQSTQQQQSSQQENFSNTAFHSSKLDSHNDQVPVIAPSLKRLSLSLGYDQNPFGKPLVKSAQPLVELLAMRCHDHGGCRNCFAASAAAAAAALESGADGDYYISDDNEDSSSSSSTGEEHSPASSHLEYLMLRNFGLGDLHVSAMADALRAKKKNSSTTNGNNNHCTAAASTSTCSCCSPLKSLVLDLNYRITPNGLESLLNVLKQEDNFKLKNVKVKNTIISRPAGASASCFWAPSASSSASSIVRMKMGRMLINNNNNNHHHHQNNNEFNASTEEPVPTADEISERFYMIQKEIDMFTCLNRLGRGKWWMLEEKGGAVDDQQRSSPRGSRSGGLKEWIPILCEASKQSSASPLSSSSLDVTYWILRTNPFLLILL